MIAASLDTETYGKFRSNAEGKPLPAQRHFHPVRCLRQDRVAPSDLIQSAALTFVDVSRPLDRSALASMTPGDTMVFHFHRADHRRWFAQWLAQTDILFGMNLLYDIPMLRHFEQFRSLLSTQTIVDLSIVNYLSNEFRPERSLEDIGRVLGTHTYDEGDKSERAFESVLDPKSDLYVAHDSHTCVVNIQRLAAQIAEDYPDSAKLSPYCLSFYSETIWSCVRMLEAGAVVSRSVLSSLNSSFLASAESAFLALRDKHNLLVAGKGSQAPRYEIMERLFAEVPSERSLEYLGVANPLDHQIIDKTPKKQLIGFSDLNRKILFVLLPPGHPAQETLRLWKQQVRGEKLASSFTAPILSRRRVAKHKNPYDCVGLPIAPDLLVVYPRCYITPSPFKDGSDDAGGQRQGRLSFQSPALSTFPKQIRTMYRSRYEGGSIVTKDLQQAELASAGILSGEETILSSFIDGVDLHTQRAISVFGLSYLESRFGPDFASNPDFRTYFRQPAKHANFTDLNLGSWYVLQKTVLRKTEDPPILVPTETCQKIVSTRAESRPQLWAYQQSCIREASEKGYLEAPFIGQTHLFVGGSDQHKPNEMVNFRIQLIAACAMLEIQHRLHRAAPPGRNPPWTFFLNQYDSVYLDISPGYEEEAHAAFDAAVHYVSTSGYWAQCCDFYGHHCPLKYDTDPLWPPSKET